MSNLYKVLLVGEHYRLKNAVEDESIGFFITLYASARDEQKARTKALELVQTDNRLSNLEEVSPDLSRIYVDEVELSQESERQETGISYFPMDGE